MVNCQEFITFVPTIHPKTIFTTLFKITQTMKKILNVLLLWVIALTTWAQTVPALEQVKADPLDEENILSGYAEMLKHGLIANEEMWATLMNFDIEKPNLQVLNRMVAESVAVKQRIVTEDPTEKGIRKALNLGHTAGHAFESLALKRKPVLHGYAVAWGLICELYLSAVKTGFPTEKMHQTVRFIREHYGKLNITCDDYPTLLELMTHDKKNVAGVINFTLLGGIGDIRINQTATKDEIYEALDFYREG